MRQARNRNPLGGMERFVKEYTAGLDSRDLRRLFDRDATRAYQVLTRGHEGKPEPKSGLKRFLYRARLAFLGLSYKLTPARRILFAASLVAFLLGFVDDPQVVMARGRTEWSLDFSPFWFGLSLAMMA